jgi:hypothetical protein
MSFLAPILTLLLFIAGVIVWRLQLVAKRRFEVAEQIMVAFFKAEAALAQIRNPFISSGEQHRIEIPDGLSEADANRRRIAGAYFERSKEAESAFVELKAAQILASVHIPEAKPHLQVPFAERGRVWGAVQILYVFPEQSFDSLPTEEFEKRMSQREVYFSRLHGMGDAKDDVTANLANAGKQLEAICRPYLSDPMWLTKLSRLLPK